MEFDRGSWRDSARVLYEGDVATEMDETGSGNVCEGTNVGQGTFVEVPV